LKVGLVKCLAWYISTGGKDMKHRRVIDVDVGFDPTEGFWMIAV
jgi:hypothetical protein